MPGSEETYIFVLKKFGGAKEQGSRFLGTECFAYIEQVDNPGQQCSAFSWTNRRFIENARLLDYCCFVVVVRAKSALVLLFGRKAHGERSHNSEEVCPPKFVALSVADVVSEGSVLLFGYSPDGNCRQLQKLCSYDNTRIYTFSANSLLGNGLNIGSISESPEPKICSCGRMFRLRCLQGRFLGSFALLRASVLLTSRPCAPKPVRSQSVRCSCLSLPWAEKPVIEGIYRPYPSVSVLLIMDGTPSPFAPL